MVAPASPWDFYASHDWEFVTVLTNVEKTTI